MLCGVPDCGVKSLLQSVVDRLRLLAADPGSEEGRQSGLPGWFPGMVERLSAQMRADAEVSQLIAEGMAYSHTYLETAHVEVPSGVDGQVFQKAKAEAVQPMPYSFYCSLDLVDQGLRLTPGVASSESPILRLCGLHFSRLQVLLSLSSGKRHSYRLARPPEPLRLPQISAAQDLVIESDLEKVYFEARERPSWAKKKLSYEAGGLRVEVSLPDGAFKLYHAWEESENPIRRAVWLTSEPPRWASRLWADEYGLAAEFRIRDVPFVLRWIPPGSFLMGSPEGGAGADE